jgi:hypothetical protein
MGEARLNGLDYVYINPDIRLHVRAFVFDNKIFQRLYPGRLLIRERDELGKETGRVGGEGIRGKGRIKEGRGGEGGEKGNERKREGRREEREEEGKRGKNWPRQ